MRPLTRQEKDHVAKIINRAILHSDFAEKGWITFYLAGDPPDLESMSHELCSLDASNLDGAEGGFIYAKVPTAVAELAVLKQIDKVRVIANHHKIRIDIIDIDSSPEIHDNQFFTLWQPE